ncbi:MAG: transcriptional repressor [Oscillospiraceae bacterium]
MGKIERNTIQRTLVLDAVKTLANHPTADEVYNFVEKQYPNISKATVYRNLNGLVSDGQVLRVHVPESADKFDYRTEEHYHISCIKCGTFADASLGYEKKIDKKVEQETGFKRAHHDLFFTGVCPNCAKLKK